MDDQSKRQTGALPTKSFFEKKRNVLAAIILLPTTLALIFLMMYFSAAGVFKGKPVVEIQAENNFSKTLYVVTDRDYAPYSYIDENGQYQGLDVEMINEIANRLKMNLDLQLLNWNNANEVFRDGEADIIMNIESDLIINDPDVIATLPTAEKQYVVYGRNTIKSVAELYGRRVASLHRMPGLGLDDEIAYIDSYETIFKELKRGEYEYAICPIQIGNEFLERYQIDDIFPSYAVTHVYGTLAMHPEDTILRVKINAVLIQMQQEGRLEQLNRKWISEHYENMTIEEMIESRPWLITMIIFSVMLVIFMIVFIVFQYREGKLREDHANELQEKLETIKEQQENLKRQQAEIIAEKTHAEESSKAKTRFLFNISHDIRTPMNAIIGYVTLASSLQETCDNCTRPRCPDEIPARLRDFIQKIGASSQHLLALINDVLEMSRIESGKMELDPEPTDIVKMFTEVKDIFAMQMDTKNIEFSVDSSGILNRHVMCDKTRFNRVLFNLLSNAYKFTPNDGKIAVTLLQKGDAYDVVDDSNETKHYGDYEMRVKDTGIGMTKEFAAKVFEAFERERTSTVSKIQGTGLGMAITKSIIDMMGGTIQVVTAPNEGTEFIINIRFEVIEEVTDTADTSAAEAPAEIDFSDKRLLLVDDIEVNREIAQMMLEASGFIIETATNGQEAVDKIAASTPGYFDAVLMDIQMPIMDGYEATRVIRRLSNPQLASIPILAITANAFSEDVQNAKSAGMNGHIAKPIDVSKLMDALTEVLRQ